MNTQPKTHCRISFDGGKKWHWATCKNFSHTDMFGRKIYFPSPHRVYMPFGKILVEKMYQVTGHYSCKNYQTKHKPIAA